MSSQVKATVTLKEKTQLVGKAHTTHQVVIDYIPPFGSDDGFMPTELLLTSLAGCSGHAIMFILNKMEKTIDDMEICAVGNRRDEHPTIFTDVELTYNLKGKNLDAASVERAISLAEEKYCPVWAMIKGNVNVTWKYNLS
jgi:putative redox protein